MKVIRQHAGRGDKFLVLAGKCIERALAVAVKKPNMTPEQRLENHERIMTDYYLDARQAGWPDGVTDWVGFVRSVLDALKAEK